VLGFRFFNFYQFSFSRLYPLLIALAPVPESLILCPPPFPPRFSSFPGDSTKHRVVITTPFFLSFLNTLVYDLIDFSIPLFRISYVGKNPLFPSFFYSLTLFHCAVPPPFGQPSRYLHSTGKNDTFPPFFFFSLVVLSPLLVWRFRFRSVPPSPPASLLVLALRR